MNSNHYNPAVVGQVAFAASVIFSVLALAPARTFFLANSLKNTLTIASMTSDASSTIQSSDEEAYTKSLRAISDAFDANDFHPSHWFGRNPHWQTIIGTGALKGRVFGHKQRSFATTEEVITTYDGDFFDVDFTSNVSTAESLVIILHGLESSNKGELVTNFAEAMLSRGFGCVLPCFRGCSGKTHVNPGGYHMGFTDDMNRLVDVLNERYPDKHIYLCGFSLGGNVCLKFLGEQGRTAWKRNIRGAAVTCVPFDPVACHLKIDVGFNRAVYSENFLQTIKAKAEQQYVMFPGSFDITPVRNAKTIGEIDDYYISKLYGYEDKFDYYAKCGSKWFLHKIRVPVLAINAIDDPFIESSSLPTEKDVKDAPVRLVYHPHGGHCGFATKYMNSRENAPRVPEYGWLGEELSRALDHIRTGVKQVTHTGST
ncbi:alpha/beta fold hydrolase [archaeon]|nr:MAG: alpha/beta fold hydrolase [archaeon]